MLKTLFKKQFMELNQNFFKDSKTGKAKSKQSVIVSVSLFAVLMLFLVVCFWFVASSAFVSLNEAGLTWMYFSLMSLVALMLGVFGSVFNTFASVYQAKDNNFLLSMPIPAKYIVLTRVFGVYLMAVLYSGLIMVPTLLAYFVFGRPTLWGVISSLLLFLIITLWVTILSCLLGYVVAKISAKLKNKSFITVIISILLFAVYYILMYRAGDALVLIIENGEAVALKLKTYAFPLYALGKIGVGDVWQVLGGMLVATLLTYLTYYILVKSFYKLAISAATSTATKAKQTFARQSTQGALVKRELKRFFSSASYMLNCGFGSVFCLIFGVFVLFKGNYLLNVFTEIGITDGAMLGLIAMVVCAFLNSTNDISAPSVSLEGKSLWLVRSLPIPTFSILKAKVYAHFVICAPFVLLASIFSCIALKVPFGVCVLAVVGTLLVCAFLAEFGLICNLKWPNLNYTNEAYAVKQGMSVFVSLFGGWLYVIVLGVASIVLAQIISASLVLALFDLINLALAMLLYHNLKTKGVKRFESL